MPSWLCISALVHRKAFIRAALRAEDLQAIRLALDLGCERPDFIKQKTLSQARCCAGISHQMSHCHDEAELVLEDVCGFVTKRPKEFLKLSVQQQCLRCSHWPVCCHPRHRKIQGQASQRDLEEDSRFVETRFLRRLGNATGTLPGIQLQETAPVFKSAGSFAF